MAPPRTLSHYPSVVVRIDCHRCPRRGCYRLARLAARFGSDLPLERLLAVLAADCPWWRPVHRRSGTAVWCGARFSDLGTDQPGNRVAPPLHRQRGPDREDLPAPARDRPAAAVPMLSAWPDDHVVLRCTKCDRHDVLAKAALLGSGDIRLTDLVHALAIDCPRRQASSVYDWCAAILERPRR